jgi:energy-coupling factor transport system permease protein
MQMSLFVPGRTLIHRFDPRAKILLVLYFSVYTFLPVSIYWLLGCYLTLTVSMALFLGIRQALSPIRSIYPILIMIAILTPPFYPEDPIGTTALLLLRITTLTTLFGMLFKTSDMSNILSALRWFGLPYQAALVVTIAFRYIPYLNQIYHQIQEAHRLRRGSPGTKGGLIKKIRQLFPVLVSVMIFAVKSIPLLSMSLEHRGFGFVRRGRRGYKYLHSDKRLFTHLLFLVMITVIFTAGPYLF